MASIAAGSGLARGASIRASRRAPVSLVWGSGGGLFVLGQIQAFDYAFTNQFRYNVRVINCSWGNSAVSADPDHPINVASRKLYELAHIVVVFANGNDERLARTRRTAGPLCFGAGDGRER